MNLGGKELDALLAKWPAHKGAATSEEDEERTWEGRADKIVAAALAAKKQGVSEATDALFSAPALAAEPGEGALMMVSAGEKKMSQEKESGESPASQAGASAPPTERKRQSLKEIAARASQAGRPSNPGTPPPSSVSSMRPPASVASAARLSQPPASAPLPRPSEAGKDDSGVINLHVVQATATAAQIAAAEKAKPAQAGLFEDEKTVESAENPAEKPKPEKPTNVAVIEAKKGNRTGAIAGVAIAVLGIAAAFAIVQKKQPAQSAPVAEVAKAPAAVATAAPTTQATAAPQPVAAAEAAPTASAEADKPADAPKGAVAAGGAATTAPTGAATSTAAPDGKLAAKAPTPSGKPGDLQSEMAKAVGKDGAGQAAPQEAAPKPEPAAGGNQNIPEQPSQGAVQSAMKSVLPAAKACVAGADDVSRAQVTFSSNGSVSSVSVSGWAAANGKSACVQAALKAAKVGPFSKPSFAVGVPIRP